MVDECRLITAYQSLVKVNKPTTHRGYSHSLVARLRFRKTA